MGLSVLTGNDTIILNNRTFSDFAEQTIAELTYPNELATVKTGKNGNSIYAQNEMGRLAELAMRIIRGSSDDKFMLNILAQQMNNFAGFSLITGSLIKKLGDGVGNINNDKYLLSGGIVMKAVPAKTNVEGDTEASVSIWTLRFSNAIRVIGS